jgi:ribosomal protein S18 acetylase RimI-like enzyme
MNESWQIERAVAGDAAAILEIQYQAYRQEAALYGDVTLPPLAETVDELEAATKTHVILKGLVDGAIVGSVRGREVDGTCRIGRLVVAPEHQGRGLGSALLAAIEDAFAHVRRFELFTGHKSLRNLGLYARRGYVEFRRQPDGDAVTLIFMEKSD